VAGLVRSAVEFAGPADGPTRTRASRAGKAPRGRPIRPAPRCKRCHGQADSIASRAVFNPFARRSFAFDHSTASPPSSWRLRSCRREPSAWLHPRPRPGFRSSRRLACGGPCCQPMRGIQMHPLVQNSGRHAELAQLFPAGRPIASFFQSARVRRSRPDLPPGSSVPAGSSMSVLPTAMRKLRIKHTRSPPTSGKIATAPGCWMGFLHVLSAVGSTCTCRTTRSGGSPAIPRCGPPWGPWGIWKSLIKRRRLLR